MKREQIISILEKYTHHDDFRAWHGSIASELLALQGEEKQQVNFMQMRDLTDEEWLQLPKEEILQLYKNCYSMLQGFISGEQSKEITTEEDITNAFCDTRDEDLKNNLQYRDRDYFQAGYDFAMKDATERTKDMFEFLEWTGKEGIYWRGNRWYYKEKEYSTSELFQYWQNEIKGK